MYKKTVLNSPRLQKLKKEKHKVLRKKILFYVFLFLLILVCLSFLSRWKEMNINNIEISGNKVIESKLVKEIVEENLSGNYFWFFPKTNFILYPQHKIERELKNKFKRIKDISINDKNIKTLSVVLSERTAKYTWCGILPPETSNQDQKCYFMDESGYIFDEAPYFSGDVYFRFFGLNDVDTENPLGSSFTKNNFSRLISFKETAEKIGLKPVAFYLNENKEVYLLLQIKESQQNPTIIFKLDTDFNKLSENLQSVLTTEPLQTDFKNKYSSLLYIDLRFGNKVYYKFK